MISSLSSGYLLKYGKWRIININNLVLVISCFCTLFDVFWVQCVARFFYGLSVGIFTVVVPKFLNETIPFEYKGPIGAFSQCMVTAGIFGASLLGLLVN
jgi:MFS family permease